MLLLQYQFVDIESERERELFEEFGTWLCDLMYSQLNTMINRRKISLRMKYLYDVSWIFWHKNKKYDTGVNDIMHAIEKSLICTPHRNNVWTIHIDNNVLIPNSNSSIDRVVRFLNYGDMQNKATGMFTNIASYYRHEKLNGLWKIFVSQNLGYVTNTKIIAD